MDLAGSSECQRRPSASRRELSLSSVCSLGRGLVIDVSALWAEVDALISKAR
jgi:hypothetical protein